MSDSDFWNKEQLKISLSTLNQEDVDLELYNIMIKLINTLNKCNKCHQVIHIKYFGKHKKAKKGVTNICKTCKSSYDRERRDSKRKEKLSSYLTILPNEMLLFICQHLPLNSICKLLVINKDLKHRLSIFHQLFKVLRSTVSHYHKRFNKILWKTLDIFEEQSPNFILFWENCIETGTFTNYITKGAIRGISSTWIAFDLLYIRLNDLLYWIKNPISYVRNQHSPIIRTDHPFGIEVIRDRKFTNLMDSNSTIRNKIKTNNYVVDFKDSDIREVLKKKIWIKTKHPIFYMDIMENT